MKATYLYLMLMIGSGIALSTATKSENNGSTIFNTSQLGTNSSATTILLNSQSIDEIPSSLFTYRSVEKLGLGDNFITTLPDGFKDLIHLKQLDLSNNKNIDLKQSLTVLADCKLTDLNLSECNLAYVPFEIGKIKTLAHLDLSNNFIIDVPLYFGKLKKLEHLDLSGNDLTDIDQGLWKCKELKVLDISDMKNLNMNEICMDLLPLNKLQLVSVSYLQDTLPVEFGAIKTQAWKIDNSRITVLPSTLSNNTTLTEVSFDYCPSVNFDQVLEDLSKAPNLTQLRISQSIDELPLSVAQLSKLKILDLSNNNLTSLPITASDLPELNQLVLYGNEFSAEEWQKILANFPNCNIQSNNIPAANNDEMSSNSTEIIQAPLPQITLPTTTEKINPLVKNTIEAEGTLISIPADAFVDAQGNPVKGTVEITYQQYDDPLEIFLSGIPMKYDSGTVSTYFQSAGMFDIRANADGQEVFLAPDKQIKIDFASNSADRDFNFYSFNETSGSWNFNNVTTPSSPTIEESVVLNNWKTGKPVSPKVNGKPYLQTEEIGVKLVKNKSGYYYRIQTHFDPGGYKLKLPEIIDVKKNSFLYTDDNLARTTRTFLNKYYGHKKTKKDFNTKIANEVLFEIDEENDCYLLTIDHGDTILQLPMKLANRVVSNYDKEQKNNAIFWKKYGKSLQKIRKANQKTIDAYELALGQFEQELKAYEEVMRDWYEKNPDKEAVTRQVIIDNFGIWNCDRIPRMDEPQTLSVNFVRPDGSSFANRNFILLDHTDCGSMSFEKTITYDKKNLISLIVFKGNEVAFCGANDFERYKSERGTVTITVEPQDVSKLSVTDIQTLLY
ncbi:MAG: leucine-rich repeat domain-containing protein [Flavobacteriales bacterium]|nr:leucine-rich repeat domain-containing protein [Flavobacteriales bacterium]